jgi:hypothetical protein
MLVSDTLYPMNRATRPSRSARSFRSSGPSSGNRSKWLDSVSTIDPSSSKSPCSLTICVTPGRAATPPRFDTFAYAAPNAS